MLLSRRQFAGGATAGLLALPWSGGGGAQAAALPAAALSAIGTYAEAHRRQYGLPGITIGLTTPEGGSAALNFGYANADARTPITASSLFEIGSISKVMTALLVHQFAASGAFGLDARVGPLLPGLPLPAGNAITVQQLLDHTSGLPDMAPLFPPGGLWTGFMPGSHYSYSNTGYELLGKLVEHVGGKPLGQLLHDRIFVPVGMTRSRGAILAADRPAYAQGYGAAEDDAPFVWGSPLAPADWVDVTSGAACVASTAEDISRFLRALAGLSKGAGGLGLDAARGLGFVSRQVPSDTVGTTYGNGLMHVAEAGHSWLHHTGGMIGYSSSFHLDVQSGIGAFASTNLTGFAEYRPLLLTRFAVEAVDSARRGRPVPPPPPLGVSLPNAASYLGTFTGPAGTIEIRPGNPLIIVASGMSAPLQPWATDLFRTTHPQFRDFSLLFEKTEGAVSHVSWGPHSFLRAGSQLKLPPSDPTLARLAGRYMNESPWWGVLRIVERQGKLWVGTDGPMTRIAENLWRVGRDSWSPERAAFSDLLDGRPQTLTFSGERFNRQDV